MKQAKWDRRRFPRWRAWGWLSGWIGDDIKVSVTDLSRGGILIEHGAIMRPGTVRMLTLSLRGEKVSIRCQVVRSAVYRYETPPVGERNYVYRTGLEFIDVSNASRRLVGRHIKFLEGVAARYEKRKYAVA